MKTSEGVNELAMLNSKAFFIMGDLGTEFGPAGAANHRSRPGPRLDRDRDREKITKIEPGTTIAVRTNEGIDVDRSDQRIYHGIVERDVRGENGRFWQWPRGSTVELKVRVAPDNDLILDLESVNVDGQRYTVRADAESVSKPNGTIAWSGRLSAR